MSCMELEARVLGKVPAKFREDRIYGSEELAGLERVWDGFRADDYHAEVKVRSRYCSTDELRAYVASEYPGLARFPAWCVRPKQDGGVEVSIGAHVIHIPVDLYRSLATEHVDAAVYENFREGWTLDLDDFSVSWIKRFLPAYLDAGLIRRMAGSRMTASRALSKDRLADRISEYGHSGMTGRTDVMGFLCDCLAYRPRGTAILLRILE